MIRFQPTAIALCLALISSQGARADVQLKLPALSRQLASSIDALATGTLARQHVPGLSLAIVRNGTVLYAKGYGYRDLDDSLPADAETTYSIGSITKQFTAAAILLLQQDGKLSIDDSLAKYLPNVSFAHQVTIRDLLTHTSGVPEWHGTSRQAATEAEALAMVSDKPLDFAPGTQFRYSNTNYILLGMIIEKISGEKYGDFLQHRIFAPLGMLSTHFNDLLTVVPDRARGYACFALGKFRHANEWDVSFADGGLTSNVLDLAKWDSALDGGKVLSVKSLQAMFTSAKLRDGLDTHYGFGLFIGSLYGHRRISHPGANPGFKALNSSFPDDAFDIVILGNSDNFQPVPFRTKIFALFYPPTAPQLAAEEFRPASGEDREVTLRAREWLHRMQTGDIDRSQLTSDFNTSLTREEVDDSSSGLSKLGAPAAFEFAGEADLGETTSYNYRVQFATATLLLTLSIDRARRISGIQIAAWE